MTVGLYCSATELSRREKLRGDRPSGLAASQSPMHRNFLYDIKLDSENEIPNINAIKVIEAMTGLTAFGKMKKAYLGKDE